MLGRRVLRGLETCPGAGSRKWGARCKRLAGRTEDSVASGGHATPASGSEGLTPQAVWKTWVMRQRRVSQPHPPRPPAPRAPGHGAGGAASQMPTGTSPSDPASVAEQGRNGGGVRKQSMKAAPPHRGRVQARKLDLAEPTSLGGKVSRPGPGVPEPQSPWDLGRGRVLLKQHTPGLGASPSASDFGTGAQK